MTSTTTLTIGTRESQLALWQANLTETLLKKSYPNLNVKIVGMKTLGDEIQNQPLSMFSDKGIFTKELDSALLCNKISCAVHCVKDLPTKIPQGLKIGAYLERGITNDCILINKIKSKNKNCKSIYDLPKSSIIGTSSLRRKALLSYHFGNRYIFKDIRGNLNTRKEKLLNNSKNFKYNSDVSYDGIILAYIGIQRLKWISDDSINISIINSNTLPYCVGQGALAILIRENDDYMSKLLDNKNINCIYSQLCCESERSLLRELEGGCKVPIGVRSNIITQCNNCNLWNNMKNNKCIACYNNINAYNSNTTKVSLFGIVSSQNGKIVKTHMESFNINLTNFENNRNNSYLMQSINLGKKVGKYLIELGADEIISKIKEDSLN